MGKKITAIVAAAAVAIPTGWGSKEAIEPVANYLSSQPIDPQRNKLARYCAKYVENIVKRTPGSNATPNLNGTECQQFRVNAAGEVPSMNSRDFLEQVIASQEDVDYESHAVSMVAGASVGLLGGAATASFIMGGGFRRQNPPGAPPPASQTVQSA